MCDSLPTYEEAIANGGRSRGKKGAKRVSRKKEVVDSSSDCDCSDCNEGSSSSCDCSDCEVDTRARRQPQRRQAPQKRKNNTKRNTNCDDGSCCDSGRRPTPKRKPANNSCYGNSCR